MAHLQYLVTDTSYGDLREPGPRASLPVPAVEGVAWMKQVHGRDVATVSVAGTTQQVDGLVTDRRGLALAVLVADCIPVLLGDSDAGVVGCGPRRTRRRPARGRRRSPGRDGGGRRQPGEHLGPARSVDLRAVLRGPGDPCRAVREGRPGQRADLPMGTPSIDLKGPLAAHLAERVWTVAVDSRCTREDESLFSYRRDKESGRFAGLVWLEP